MFTVRRQKPQREWGASAGRYKSSGTLTIPEGVALRGDWKRPTEADKRVEGTILMPTAGKNQPDGKPFIQITGGSGVNNLSIFYPEQTAPEVRIRLQSDQPDFLDAHRQGYDRGDSGPPGAV